MILQGDKLKKEDILKEPYAFRPQPINVKRKVGVHNIFMNAVNSKVLSRLVLYQMDVTIQCTCS